MAWKNEFVDAGFNAPDATVWALRSDLARILRLFMAKQPSQTAAARRLGISQGMVSNIMGGRIDKISMERLVKLMVLAGIPATAQWSGSADAARAVTGNWVAENTATQSDEGEAPLVPIVDEETWQWWLSATRAVVSQTAQ